MKKVILVTLLTVVTLIWVLFTADCVINRFNSGIPIDWANIKDCSY